MTKKLTETCTNLDKKSIHFSDKRSSCKKISKTLFCCKTLKIGLNIGSVKKSIALFQIKSPKSAVFGNTERCPDILNYSLNIDQACRNHL